MCQEHLSAGVNPVVQLDVRSKIILVGQAPGRIVHQTGIPWNDRSGDTLRKWLDVSKDDFYNPEQMSIMGMGFCYPGKGRSGDLPPRPECAKHWHPKILEFYQQRPMVILIGQYAQKYYLGQNFRSGLTETVKITGIFCRIILCSHTLHQEISIGFRRILGLLQRSSPNFAYKSACV